MKKNKFTRIIGQSVILIPYKKKHVIRYHEWMKSPELQYLTASEPLTLAEEYEMQKDWLLDEKKCTFIILDKTIFHSTGDEIAAMIGDTNLFFNDMECKHTAEAEIMIAEKESRSKRRGWEAILLMLRYGIDTLNVQKYRVKIMIDNERSINMFRKLNFHEVGRSEIFQEVTMENNINDEWKDWLYSETINSVTDECYNTEFYSNSAWNKCNQSLLSLFLANNNKPIFIMLLKLSNFARRRPLLLNSMTYGFFYTCAEFAQQSYNKKFKINQPVSTYDVESQNIDKPIFLWLKKCNNFLGLLDNESSILTEEYNWPRLKRFAIYGFFLAGPLLHGWYKWLDTFYKGKSIKLVLTKVFVDQFILTPPLVCLFFISMSLMESKSDILEECKTKFVKTFQTSCLFWIPVQFFNFVLIPPTLRITYVSIAALCWVNILCYIKNVPLVKFNDKY
ncbi:PREDICTED: uncharacterized protein LOC106785058 [Polistes canadensis]|uniref:uncharacterized protein LOC106785058 n=1 Tax=Polistes canadensis TaxID=91411 RepID=UPI000718CA81|nr:PREDICTED: uncharacterized protein LOC106785058 [Polistes canadensis]